MKTVLITGASGNLGRDVVEHLHQQGYAVLATFGSSREMGMFNHLPQVKTQVVNVLDADSVTAFLDEHEAANLRAAVLLVGGFAMGSIRETDADLLHKMYQLNFLSAFNVVKPLLARFEQQRDGQFILIGARPSLNPDEGKNVVAYALSKTLVFALAELINAEGKAHQITASVVVPGIIDTPANRNAMPDADPSRWVPTDNLAELIAFLLSDTGRMTRETVVNIYNHS
ncbi:SDR family NAD(P)-dependent oxidoreductase [Spirosoma arcticum]